MNVTGAIRYCAAAPQDDFATFRSCQAIRGLLKGRRKHKVCAGSVRSRSGVWLGPFALRLRYTIRKSMSIKVHGAKKNRWRIYCISVRVCRMLAVKRAATQRPGGKTMNQRSTKEGHNTVRDVLCVANGVVRHELGRQMHNSIYRSCLQCP